jgi:hypothetical protein
MSVFKHPTLIHLFLHSFSLHIVQLLFLIQQVLVFMWGMLTTTLAHRLVAKWVQLLLWRSIWESMLFFLFLIFFCFISFFIVCFPLYRRTAHFWLKGKLVPYYARGVPQSVLIGVCKFFICMFILS